GFGRAHPKGVDSAARKEESKADALPGEPLQVTVFCPGHKLQRLVLTNGDASFLREWLDYLAFVVQYFNAQLAFGRVDIDEQVPAPKTERPRRQCALLVTGIH